MYKCQFCGFESASLNDFEEDTQHHKGFFCSYCDGFTYFEKEQNHHTFKLILESKTKNPVSDQSLKTNFPTQVSPLRWPGGKSKFIAPILMRCNPQKMTHFVEPFAGGASVGLALLMAGKCKELYLNDLDYGIYALFLTIKNDPEALIDKIRNFMPSKCAYKNAQSIIKNNYKNQNIFEAGWNLLVANRLAYSGIPKANCMSDPSARWNSETLISRIKNIHHVSDHIHISCMDACQFIEEMYWSLDSTIFIDPPYKMKGKDLYIRYYNDEDHIKLAFLLEELYKGIPGADMLVTYDECEFIKDIYEFPDVETLRRNYCIAN